MRQMVRISGNINVRKAKLRKPIFSRPFTKNDKCKDEQGTAEMVKRLE